MVKLRWNGRPRPNLIRLDSMCYVACSPSPVLSASTPDLIFAQGEGGFGTGSDFPDEDVTNGTTYYYKLEEIQTNNSSQPYPGYSDGGSGRAPRRRRPARPAPALRRGRRGLRRRPRLRTRPRQAAHPAPRRRAIPARRPARRPHRLSSPTSNGTRQSTATPLPPGMVALTTATAAARETPTNRGRADGAGCDSE